MPIIRVEMFEGRTSEQKSQLVDQLTKDFVRTCGGKIESVQVLITEYAPSDWGVAGELASEKAKRIS